MIAGVRGRIRSCEPGVVSVETASGLFMRVMVPVSIFSDFAPGREVELFTTLRLKDDTFQLYGFSSREQRSWFEELITISGIGGKIALALISAFSADELAGIIDAGDFVRLSSVPGIGKKTAQRVVLEMSGRLGRVVDDSGDTRIPAVENDLVSGLVNLGFSLRPARDAVSNVLKSPGGAEKPFNELFKLALKRISRQ
ncbi:MAG TPA: Holliday junction branch migration protein RuvA [Candidatus Aminicenantes bacterium]|nr:Holliday junction branch migration protein RuvA [Candidatus Aminicenantes bacterium]